MKTILLFILTFYSITLLPAQNWNEIAKIVGTDRMQEEEFGEVVAISPNYAIVGIEKEDEDVTGGNFMEWADAAYIFERSNTGNRTEVQKIVATDREIHTTTHQSAIVQLLKQ